MLEEWCDSSCGSASRRGRGSYGDGLVQRRGDENVGVRSHRDHESSSDDGGLVPAQNEQNLGIAMQLQQQCTDKPLQRVVGKHVTVRRREKRTETRRMEASLPQHTTRRVGSRGSNSTQSTAHGRSVATTTQPARRRGR